MEKEKEKKIQERILTIISQRGEILVEKDWKSEYTSPEIQEIGQKIFNDNENPPRFSYWVIGDGRWVGRIVGYSNLMHNLKNQNKNYERRKEN